MGEVAVLREVGVRETHVAKDLGWSHFTGVYHAQTRGLGLLFKQKREKKPLPTTGTHRVIASRCELSSGCQVQLTETGSGKFLFSTNCGWLDLPVPLPTLNSHKSPSATAGLSLPLIWRCVALQLRISCFPAMQSDYWDPNYFATQQELTESKDDSFMRAIYFQRSWSAVRFGPLDFACLFPLRKLTYAQSLHL